MILHYYIYGMSRWPQRWTHNSRGIEKIIPCISDVYLSFILQLFITSPRSLYNEIRENNLDELEAARF